MDPQTFFSIHSEVDPGGEFSGGGRLIFGYLPDLTTNANILYASESISDILGYSEDEVQKKSAFDYFHPEDVPFARSIFLTGILLDEAAALYYVRIRCKDGQWVSCECCFTVAHNVLVASMSIYFKRYHLLPAITVDGILDLLVYKGHTDKDGFVAWLENGVLPKMNRFPGPNSILVMDNASWHHDNRVTQLAKQYGVVI